MTQAARIMTGGAMLAFIAANIGYASTTTSIKIGLTATVRPSCNIGTAMDIPRTWEPQVNSDGTIEPVSFTVIPNANSNSSCNFSGMRSSLQMVSKHGGIKNGGKVISYKIIGTFNNSTAAGSTNVQEFDSTTSSTRDLLAGEGIAPLNVSNFKIQLSDPHAKSMVSGSYGDVLTLIINANP